MIPSTSFVLGAVFLGSHQLLLDLPLQVLLFLRQHFFSLPELVEGLLRRGVPPGPVVVFRLRGAQRAGAGAAFEQFGNFAHFAQVVDFHELLRVMCL